MSDMHNATSLRKARVSMQLLAKWQKIVDLMTRAVDVPAGLIVRNMQPNLEVLLTSSNHENPFVQGTKLDSDSDYYCRHVYAHRAPLMVQNAHEDPRWDQVPVKDSNMSAYLGFPILWPDAEIFGTLCLLDRQEKHFTDLHIDLLAEFKEVIEADLFYLMRDSQEWDGVQRALIESENKYRELVEEAASIILRWDTKGNITFFNEFAQQFFGFSEKEILGKNVVGTIVPDKEFNGRDLEKLMKEICKDPTSFEENENQNIKRDGTRVWIMWKNKPIYNDKGELYEILSVGIDITARKKTEETLKETEEQQRALLNAMPDRMFLFDQKGTFLHYHIVDESDLYVPPEQFLGKTVMDILPHKQAVDSLAAYKKVLKTGEMLTLEFQLPINNENRYFEERLVLCGKNKVMSLIRDITEPKRVENELRQAATVFENTDEGIMIINAQKEIVAVNSAFTKISGYTSDEVLGMDPRIQISGEHSNQFYSDMWSALERFGSWRGEIWYKRKNGEIYPAWENISTVYDTEGQVTRYVSVFSDISSIKESESRFNYLTHHDVLTGLSNRLMLISDLDHVLDQAKNQNEKIALIYMDLDHFKIINDTLGRSNGDRLLQEVTRRLKECLRNDDTIARVGGDEFVIIITQIHQAEDAQRIAEIILEKIAQPIQIESQQVTTSTSIGISLFPEDADDSESLVRAADTAMYHVKEQGRGSLAFYSSELSAKAFAHFEVEHGLRDAISNNQLVLYYQPQVSLDSMEVVAVEALVRWQHPEQGLLGPDVFIPVAEKTGLMRTLGEWILRTACEEIRSWSALDKKIRLAVNISACQLISRQGLTTIWQLAEELTKQQGMPELDLEITESALLTAEHNLDGLDRLKAAGVTLSIDDFGTGYSSLTRIKELPIDALKIDRSFVRGIPDDENDIALVSATIAMAHRLGLKVIAEGVETKEQLEFLRQERCDEIQGYIISEPLPLEKLKTMLGDRVTIDSMVF
jgi:diguanylate cyclase (GGDEF)-like protein/PAS domain S-box-containing protein